MTVNFDDLKRMHDRARASGIGSKAWIDFATTMTDTFPELYGTAKTMNATMRDVFPVAHRLALELECLLLSCTDTVATAKWGDSANEALEQWREFCREDSTHNAVADSRPD